MRMGLMKTDRKWEIFPTSNHQFGELTRYQCDAYETSVHRWGEEFELSPRNVSAAPGCAFGFVHEGVALLEVDDQRYSLRSGQYFCVNADLKLAGGQGIIVVHHDFRPLTMVGGPIEASGRLKYISGCTDTLLVAPPRKGDPCFNALFFPPATNQQSHTHPSIRVGIVASGKGIAEFGDCQAPLLPGDIFVIPVDEQHRFCTTDESMVIIAYHPDSDCGPVDDDHPMINRTIIDVQSFATTDNQ